ncbi:MAG TPA: alcohol dehydrogenase catalytic domain-containing protein [Patescibacteria group bacterium]|nr:alcohol dehydrogenase catalytic domain-containing protein [Patescibacteria group bacterium]
MEKTARDKQAAEGTAMHAIYFNGEKLLKKTMPKPRRGRLEALVRVHLAGICATDLEILEGYMGLRGVPGHEFVGTVESAPRRELIGKRVVGEINIPCGKCSICRRGLGKHCPTRSVLGIQGKNGAFAEYLTLPVKNLHTVPAGIPDEAAVFTELLAAACEVPARVTIHRGQKVAVLGDGRLAAMVAQVLALRTDHVNVFGTDKQKLALIGKTGVSTHGAGQLHAYRRSFDTVVECTGSPEGLPAAADLVRPQGTIVLKSTYHGALQWNPSPLVVDEITIVGSRCGPFDTALRLLALEEIVTRPFLTAVYPFVEWRRAFEHAREPGSFKIAVRLD